MSVCTQAHERAVEDADERQRHEQRLRQPRGAVGKSGKAKRRKP